MKFFLLLVSCPFVLSALLSGQVVSIPAVAPAPVIAPTVRCTVAVVPALSDADRAFNSGDFANSEQLFSAELTADPTSRAYAGLVRSQLQQGKATEALATARKAAASGISLHSKYGNTRTTALPASAETQTLLGEALLRNSQIVEASAAFSRATALDRCFARAHFGAGEMFDLASMHAAAHREFTVAHQLAPSDDEIGLAWANSLAPGPQIVALRELLADTKTLDAEQHQALAAQLALLEKSKTCHLATPVANAKLDLMPLLYNGTHVRDWGLNAKFNDRKSALLELDTSVSGIVLGRSFAAKAGVENILGAQNGASSEYMGYADSVKIGPFDFKDCPVRVVDDAALANGNGLISADVFKDSLITINFANRTFTLSPLPKKPEAPAIAPDAPQDRYAAPELKDWTRVYIDGGRILVPTGINSSGPFLFMLDTGAVFTTLSPDVAKTVLNTIPDITAPLIGVSAKIVKVYFKNAEADFDHAQIYGPHGQLIKVMHPVKTAIYQFGPYKLLDNEGYSFDITPLSRTTHVGVAGLLGFPIMKDFGVAIDYRDGLIQFIFDKQHVYRTREGTYY